MPQCLSSPASRSKCFFVSSLFPVNTPNPNFLPTLNCHPSGTRHLLGFGLSVIPLTSPKWLFWFHPCRSVLLFPFSNQFPRFSQLCSPSPLSSTQTSSRHQSGGVWWWRFVRDHGWLRDRAELRLRPLRQGGGCFLHALQLCCVVVSQWKPWRLRFCASLRRTNYRLKRNV